MKAIQTVVLILLAAVLFTACTNTLEPVDDSLSESKPEENDVQTEPEIISPLPPDLDFNKAVIKILHSNDLMLSEDVEELSGDIVNDAIYTRNAKVQEQLNCSFEYILEDYNLAPIITNSVLAGSDDFHMISGMQWIIAPVVLENYLANLADAEYLNIEREWWATDYIKEAGIGNDKRFFIAGDITLSMLQYMSCVYFNKGVYENIFGDPSDMYLSVVDGKWTFDMLNSMGKDCYFDINGNGVADDDDCYAYALHTLNLTDHLTYDAGLRVTQRGNDGIPYLVVNTERTVDFVQKMYDLFYANEGAHIYPGHADTNNIVIPGKLKANELLFALGWFNTSELLRDMENDYGLIPYPKYDETQQTYLSLVHDSAFVYSAPITCSPEMFDMVCAIMEGLAFEAYYNVTPVYYEIALKIKYVRESDDLPLRIVDMIRSGATTDFAYIYNYALDGIGLFMRNLMTSKSSDFSSFYASKESSVTAKFETLIELYTSLE